MVHPEVLRRRLEQSASYIQVLKEAQTYSLEAFLEDPVKHGSVERFLHLTIEALNDMGAHVVADENLGTVEQTRDVPMRLHEHGVLDEETRDLWISMIGFRNVLVHDYMDLDRELVYDVLQNRLSDFESIRRVLAGFL